MAVAFPSILILPSLLIALVRNTRTTWNENGGGKPCSLPVSAGGGEVHQCNVCCRFPVSIFHQVKRVPPAPVSQSFLFNGWY